MTRDKQFVINSIKMDLHRVVVATGILGKAVPKRSVQEFLQHALADFKKIDLTVHEQELKEELEQLSNNMEENIKDPHKRLRWAEKVLTARCRL